MIDEKTLKCVLHGKYVEVDEEIIRAVKRQIPMKPTCYEDKFIHCPCCDKFIGYKWNKYREELMDYSWIEYCYQCGQALDWSDEE